MVSTNVLEKLDREWVEEKKRHGSMPRFHRVALICSIAGFPLVMFGLWLVDLGDDVRLERLLHPWPAVCIVLGVCFILGSLTFMLGNSRHRAYNQARNSYDDRREKLIQEIYASEQDSKNPDSNTSS